MRHLSVAGRPDESEAKELLRQFGIPVPRGVVIRPHELPEQRLREAGSPAPPWAVKVSSPYLLHKTESRAVLLGLDASSLPGAIADLRSRFPGARILVEEQLDHEGPEFIIGAMMDPWLGTAIMAGAGGIYTELYSDTAFRLAPCPVQEAKRMLSELTVFPVLQGYRGARMDASSLAALVSQVGEMALEFGEDLEALDINPVVFTREGWAALDAKLMLRNPAR